MTLQGEVLFGSLSLEQAVHGLGKRVGSYFGSSSLTPSSLSVDFVRVRSAKGKQVLKLRRDFLSFGAIEDTSLLDRARREKVAGIVTTKGESSTYIAGAAPFATRDAKGNVFLLGIKLDDALISQTGLTKDTTVFVVGDSGVVAASGPQSQDENSRRLAATTPTGLVDINKQSYISASEAIGVPGSPTLHAVSLLPRAPFRQAASRAQLYAWLVIALGVTAFVLTALWLAGSLTKPLFTLTRAAREMAEGNLDARAAVRSGDEIGVLAQTFNQMGDELSRRDARLKEALEELRRMSETDPLTGLLNHRAIHKALEREMALAHRHHLTFCIVVIDIDSFKLINDTYGHPAGDAALRQVAATLIAETRAGDLVGRHGGDEFMLVLPQTDTVEALQVINKLTRAMDSQPFTTPDGAQIPIHLSLGVAGFPADGRHIGELLNRADTNLYAAKRLGGNMVSHGRGGEPSRRAPEDGLTTLDSLVTAVNNKDRYTHQHSEDVTRLSLMIADELQLDSETRKTLRTAGLLHDVGKIGVPDDALLRKPGRLSEQEYELVKRHPTMGAALIQGIDNEDEIRTAIMSHHENWDGSGFPNGISGESIPLLARILAAADAYSAMTSDRPYRKALDCETAIEQLKAGSGTQLDPEIIPLFIRALRRHACLSDDRSDKAARVIAGAGGDDAAT